MDKVIKNVSNIELSSRVKEHLEYTYRDFQEYLEKLLSLEDKVLRLYLKTIKSRELLNNQEAELEESFLIELYRMYQRKDSIELIMQHFQDGNITKDEIRKLRRVVIKGSQDDEAKNYGYRTDNNKWVGCFGTNGRMDVDYYPPDYKELDELMDFTLDVLNNKQKNEALNHVLIKPFVVHGMLGYLQPFGNGNTRLARVVQHGKLWHMTNEELGLNLPSPAIYLSKNYFQTRPQYRNLIKRIANSEDWNAWLNYNLNMMDEQLFYSGNNLSKVRTIL